MGDARVQSSLGPTLPLVCPNKSVPQSSLLGVAEQAEPRALPECTLQAPEGVSAGSGAPQAVGPTPLTLTYGNKEGALLPIPDSGEAAPGQVGMCLECWGQFRNRGKGQKEGQKLDSGPRVALTGLTAVSPSRGVNHRQNSSHRVAGR